MIQEERGSERERERVVREGLSVFGEGREVGTKEHREICEKWDCEKGLLGFRFFAPNICVALCECE